MVVWCGFICFQLKHLTPEQQSTNTLTKYLAWREKEKVDDLVKENLPYRPELAATWPCGVHGYDSSPHHLITSSHAIVLVSNGCCVLLIRSLQLRQRGPTGLQYVPPSVAA